MTARRGRDRKAEMLQPPPGRAILPPATPPPYRRGRRAGIAGLAAATLLAERGARVTLYEREESLGGRLAGWRTRLSDGASAPTSAPAHPCAASTPTTPGECRCGRTTRWTGTTPRSWPSTPEHCAG
jgi:hypothetical protein